jgi:hypothetical protein
MSISHRIKTSLAVAVVLATGAGAGSASARYANGEQVPASIPVAPLPASTQPTLVGTGPSSGGFDWGDAGIGAAGGFAISMLGIGGALTLSQRRGRETALS